MLLDRGLYSLVYNICNLLDKITPSLEISCLLQLGQISVIFLS